MLGVWLVALVIGFYHPIQAEINKSKSKNIDLLIKSIDYLDDLLVVAVATSQTDSHDRLIRSLNVYGYKYEVNSFEFFKIS
jgi:hypothetical protein